MCRGHTEGPIPVWLGAAISALLLQGCFEVLDVCAMPGQELASEVDLFLCLVVVRGRMRLTGTYNWIKIHVDVDKVCFDMK